VHEDGLSVVDARIILSPEDMERRMRLSRSLEEGSR